MSYLKLKSTLDRLNDAQKCDGWDVFNGNEVQRDDEADVFESDLDAVAHIATCRDCSAKLGRSLATFMLANGSTRFTVHK